MQADLYVSIGRYYDGDQVVGASPEVSYQPIEWARLPNWWNNLTLQIDRQTESTVRVSLPPGWRVTEALGIVNVEMPVPATIEGHARRFVDPRALLLLARAGEMGLRIVKGVDPFPKDQSTFEALNRRTLFPMEV